MAQAGYTPISLYYSTTAAAVPTAGNLVPGELAININDGKLYYENSSGVVTLLAQSSATSPVTTLSFGTTGLTPSTATSGAITVAGTLAVANGGTGVTSTGAAPFALKGANSDITSLAGLTTPLSVSQGGIGASTLTANNVLLGNGTAAPLSVAPSTAGNVLTSNGTTWTSAAPTGGGVAGGFVSVQYFTTVGAITWTRPSGIKKIYVYVIGGGGGGQSANSGCGGGGGGCAIKMIDVTSISSITGNVGSGGAVDTAGGTSTFNTTIIGVGGGTGTNSGGYPIGGVGGGASGGDLNIPGETAGANGTGGAPYAGTQGGKPAFFGVAGAGGGYANSAGAGVYGGGGGGQGYNTAGAGGSGIIVVYEYN